MLTYSGFLFASQYTVTLTSSRTFAAAPWNYTPIEVGLVLLAFGLGNVVRLPPARLSSLPSDPRRARAHTASSTARLGRRRALL